MWAFRVLGNAISIILSDRVTHIFSLVKPLRNTMFAHHTISPTSWRSRGYYIRAFCDESIESIELPHTTPK
jgi:hypothetical protein